MGFYIEDLPTEFNGITMQEADYLADEFLKDTPCNRMWDAMRALRDFYETVTSEAVKVADRKTEPFDKDINVRSKDEPQTEGEEVEWVYNKRERLWYPYSNGELLFKDKPTTQTETQNSNLTFDTPQTERHLPDYSYEADLGRRIMEQTERSK